MLHIFDSSTSTYTKGRFYMTKLIVILIDGIMTSSEPCKLDCLESGLEYIVKLGPSFGIWFAHYLSELFSITEGLRLP